MSRQVTSPDPIPPPWRGGLKRIAGFVIVCSVLLAAGFGFVLLQDTGIRHQHTSDSNVAVSCLRTLILVNEQYRARRGAYADDLESLEQAQYIDHVFASGRKSRYIFRYRAGEHSWTCFADPAPETSDDTAFYVDETGVIRFSRGRPAAPDDPPIEKTPVK